MGNRNKIFRGTPASPGIVIKRAVFYEVEKELKIEKKVSLDKMDEESKFREALRLAREELEGIKRKFESTAEAKYTRILEAQLLVIEDSSLIEGTINKIRGNNFSAETAFNETVEEILEGFEKIKDEYLKARIADIRDVTNRILRKLKGEPESFNFYTHPHILVAEDLTPSETASLDKSRVVGFVTELGGETSHTAIMAKAMGIPAVVGVEGISNWIRTGDEVIVDGQNGIVVVDPNTATRRIYEKRLKKLKSYEKGLLGLKKLPPETIDGYSVELACNIELPEEVELVISYGAKIIGLLRTEFLYIKGEKLPTEEEQFEVYKKIAEKVDSVIIRTLDLGGDKFPLFNKNFHIKEGNPALGWRGVRFSLDMEKIFHSQLKAIVEASKYGDVKILIPMIQGIEEIQKVKQHLKKLSPKRKIELGVMMEVPSAALLAEEIAQEVDFLSIGSNDLTQYTLACDRTNYRVAKLYNPLHPSVLRLIKQIIDGGHRKRKWVGCCGELAMKPVAIPILIGLGIDELSVAPIYILEVKKIIREISKEEAKEVANKVVEMKNITEVVEYLEKVKERIPVLKQVMKLK